VVTTKKKTVIITQKRNRKNPKHTTTKNKVINIAREEKWTGGTVTRPENVEENSSSKSFPINNYLKFQWLKLHNKMTQSRWTD
jgi:hypothetical protein